MIHIKLTIQFTKESSRNFLASNGKGQRDNLEIKVTAVNSPANILEEPNVEEGNNQEGQMVEEEQDVIEE